MDMVCIDESPCYERYGTYVFYNRGDAQCTSMKGEASSFQTLSNSNYILQSFTSYKINTILVPTVIISSCLVSRSLAPGLGLWRRAARQTATVCRCRKLQPDSAVAWRSETSAFVLKMTACIL